MELFIKTNFVIIIFFSWAPMRLFHHVLSPSSIWQAADWAASLLLLFLVRLNFVCQVWESQVLSAKKTGSLLSGNSEICINHFCFVTPPIQIYHGCAFMHDRFPSLLSLSLSRSRSHFSFLFVFNSFLYYFYNIKFRLYIYYSFLITVL